MEKLTISNIADTTIEINIDPNIQKQILEYLVFPKPFIGELHELFKKQNAKKFTQEITKYKYKWYVDDPNYGNGMLTYIQTCELFETIRNIMSNENSCANQLMDALQSHNYETSKKLLEFYSQYRLIDLLPNYDLIISILTYQARNIYDEFKFIQYIEE